MGHIVITGGSSGIGAAFAERFAELGDDVSIVARGAERLAARVAALEARFGGEGQRFFGTAADVVDAPALLGAVEACERALGPCSTLVTSAGLVKPGDFLDQAAAEFDGQIATNLIGTANAIRSVLPGMVERRAGRILIIGSGAGLLGIPGYSAYCASKSGLGGMAEALRYELKPRGIGVHICFPPDTDTPQFRAELPLRPPAAHVVIGKAEPWSSEALAAHTIEAVRRGTFAIYPGAAIRTLGLFGSVLTPVLRAWFDGRIAARQRRTS